MRNRLKEFFSRWRYYVILMIAIDLLLPFTPNVVPQVWLFPIWFCGTFVLAVPFYICNPLHKFQTPKW